MSDAEDFFSQLQVRLAENVREVGRIFGSTRDLTQDDFALCPPPAARVQPTPQGVLVSDAEPETPEWFATRRGGITGTDLPKLLGLSKYGNALTVHADKSGDLPPDSSGEAALWGHRLEDVVAQEWALRNGATVRRVGVIANRWCGWMRASLDRLVDGTNEGLEVKTRSAYVAHHYDDTLPDDVLAQVHWGLLVTGLDRMHVAVLIGGQQLRQFTVERDPAIEIYLATIAGRAWRGVLDGIPPDLDPDEDGVMLAALNRLYPDRSGAVDLDDHAESVSLTLGRYRTAGSRARQAEEHKTLARTELVALLGGAHVGMLGGEKAFTYKAPPATTTVTANQLKRLTRDRPGLVAALTARGYITHTTPAPRFTLPKETS